MKLIRPTPIVDASLVTSSVPETDYPAWAAGTAYTVGQRVIRVATHRCYERLIAGTTATAPELDPVNWLNIGPTNRWAMFDGVVGTLSSGTTPMSFSLAPGMVDSLALLDISAGSVSVAMVSGGSTVYSRSASLESGNAVADWFMYFFEPIVRKTAIVFTDLPPHSDGVITVTLANASEAVTLGTVVVGRLFTLGKTRQGANIGIIDYSRKEADPFGVISVVKRSFAKKINAQIMVAGPFVDEIARVLAGLRATPVVWIGGGNLYDSLIVFGFYKDWDIEIGYPDRSLCSLQIEGLT